ncbi:hypothetical protein Lser_V15G12918 [Lactuca serriola]
MSRIQQAAMATEVQRIMTHLIGFDEYMNLVLEDAEEVSIKKKTRKALVITMLCVATKLTRSALSSAENHSSFFRKQSFFTNYVGRESGIKHSIPGDYHKWVSIPTHNFSSFAYGFTPLKHKPLESLINVEREKLQTPEDLASI